MPKKPAPKSKRPPTDPVAARKNHRDTHGFSTVGGTEITFSDLDAMAPARRAATHRAIWLGNTIEAEIANLIRPSSDKELGFSITLVNVLWEASRGQKWRLLIKMNVITAFEEGAAGRESYGADPRSEAVRVACRYLGRAGYADVAAVIQHAHQSAADVIAAWWGEIKVGGKWPALSGFFKTVMQIDTQASSLRVEYSRWKRKCSATVKVHP